MIEHMLHYLMHDLVIHLICFQTVILLVILSNAWILYRARRHVPPSLFPKVSILIPARNEEKNIAGCVSSLLAQDYPSFEVIVLDDQSSDNTRSILMRIAGSEPRLSVLAGSPLPEGRLGKNWACAQLAQRANGDQLYFTDADTIHQPQALRALVTTLIGEQADLLTGFPGQELQTWGERLIVPFFFMGFLLFHSSCVGVQAPTTGAFQRGRTNHAISLCCLSENWWSRQCELQYCGRPITGAAYQSQWSSLACNGCHKPDYLPYVFNQSGSG
jgi:cellulose synthase/poly-beta-1,6-N-acetylglucosamine synthase-like glycosyltransferase